ncbi:MAG: lysophospholipase, partial [Bdellovibrionales bacterium]|nr:lysophospholipase [Bdellovibrionales bacterium]
MIQQTEGYFAGYDKKQLYYQTWSKGNAEAIVIVTHGLAEHSGAYKLFSESLLSKLPLDIYSWDLRGHGRSEGKRGLVGSFQEYIKDYHAFYKLVKSGNDKQLPIILLGHSMGGLVTVKFLLDYEANIEVKGFVLSSPLLGISMKVSPVKDYAAKMLVNLLPTITMNNEIDFRDLSHDLEVIKSYDSDPFRHNRISPKLYLDFLETFPKVFEAAHRIQLPALIQFAGDDRIVDKVSTLKFFNTLGSIQKE